MKLAKIVFRCDGSNEIGFGHLRRCINLAQWLRGKFDVAFFTKKTKESSTILKKTGIETHYLEKDIDANEDLNVFTQFLSDWSPKIIVNDIKNTSSDYMQAISLAKARLVNFDDLGDGADLADVVIDANRRENKKKLFGPKYVILHDDFAREHKRSRTLHKHVKNLVVAIGGGDPHNYTQKILECLEGVDYTFNTAVILGPTFKDIHHIKQKWKNHERVYFLEDLETLVKPLLWADCAIVNGGLTMFESLCLGTPTLVVSQNTDEVKNVKRLERKNAVLDVGLGKKVSVNKLNKRLRKVCDNLEFRKKLSDAGKEIVDGKGIFRVLGIIEKLARKR
ncbi:MAG: UDP-2,4-diacetamido-2,4,6-trideoxy-beta-L-altropyranose hydrolase [Candidatus Omnitrophica bacterium]|nr:UDP-2,4-diacetamido-2,4,6-trideoxy-beta-L-altropyranose hydrolase [Candidatus Omnitrophota bacterium]